MTVKEIENEMLMLGFEASVYPEELIVSSANRALKVIWRDCDLTVRKALYLPDIKPQSYLGHVHYKGGTPLTLPLAGAAYCMTAVGRGCVQIRDGAEIRTVSFDGDGEIIRGFLSEGGDITLSGELSYDILHLTTYPEIYSDTEDSIPQYTSLREVDMNEVTEDFGGFFALPRDGGGKEIRDAVLCGSVIRLPEGFSGEFTVEYRRLPKRIPEGDPHAEIDLPESLTALLVLLTAAFVWLDEEKEKAELYLSMYKDMKKTLNERGGFVYAGYETNGWA